ncbi:hypothetical protein B0H17DRAFT_1251597 [Mycena rosella]|uniref:Uncharacterized protein n=1 Tax=Mycena rosella TaxID=1033263 RepID=A0AAD7CXA5_MYCRO|nr:hypothetical protein B0H17DRAFT_1251597 [Mycena rosella]
MRFPQPWGELLRARQSQEIWDCIQTCKQTRSNGKMLHLHPPGWCVRITYSPNLRTPRTPQWGRGRGAGGLVNTPAGAACIVVAVETPRHAHAPPTSYLFPAAGAETAIGWSSRTADGNGAGDKYGGFRTRSTRGAEPCPLKHRSRAGRTWAAGVWLWGLNFCGRNFFLRGVAPVRPQLPASSSVERLEGDSSDGPRIRGSWPNPFARRTAARLRAPVVPQREGHQGWHHGLERTYHFKRGPTERGATQAE